MTRVVFNADDLGMSAAIDSGILRAAATGWVREASVCVTGAELEETERRLRDAPSELGIGLHLSLTFGKALTGPIPGLTDAAGHFASLPRVLAACLSRRVSSEAVGREVSAQVERAAERFRLTHVNGHHHVHVFPVVRDAVLAHAPAGSHLRIPKESVATAGPPNARWLLLRALSRGFARRARRQRPALRALTFVGLSLTGASEHERRFLQVARRLGDAPAEWMVHPRADDARVGFAELGARAAQSSELITLESSAVHEQLEEIGLKAASYRDLYAEL